MEKILGLQAPMELTSGAVAYKIKLPSGSSIHDVFHVSQLKKHVGEAVTSSSLPCLVEGDPLIKEPEAILDRMPIKRRGRVVTKVLVKWKHSLPEDATWEFFFDLKQRYPHFQP